MPGSDRIHSLVLDLLEWIDGEPRPYVEVLEAWRTSCPRLPVWEEANGPRLHQAPPFGREQAGRVGLRQRRPLPEHAAPGIAVKGTILDDYHGTLRTLDCFATLAGRSASTATAASSPATARRSAWTCRCGHAPTRASAPAPTDTPWRRARRRSSPNRSTPHIGYVTRDE